MVKILSSYDEIIAKTNGTSLKKHSCDSHNILKILLESNKELFENWSKLNNVDLNIFLNNLEKATYAHDFGKATDKWQENALQIEEGGKLKLPPHAIYSGYFLSKVKNPDDWICLLSCISHHSLLTENSFNSIQQIEYYDEYLNDLINKKSFNFKKIDSLNKYFKILRKFRDDSQYSKFRSIFEKDINILFKAKYCLMLSYLTRADGLSSSFEENSEKISKYTVLERFPNSLSIYNKVKNIENNKIFTDIQEKVINIKQSNAISDLIKPIMLEAPCGEGKTLASLLYSKILLKNNLVNKVIFALPTQVTSNNMFFEFEDEYKIPKEWIGIYHSEVLSFLSNLKDDECNEIFDNVSLEKYSNLIYSKPFNISTIDHLLLSLVNGFKFAPRAFGNIINSLIIIDELHYYDSRTILLIECLCEILRFLNIPHVIMSATIPEHIKNKFNDSDYLKVQSSGCDIKGIEKNPFKFQYHENLIYEENILSDEFLNVLKKNIGKNIGIIVNTVNKSKDLYEYIKREFPGKQIFLYNSQFMKKDRPIKEKLLKIFSKSIYTNNLTDSEKNLMLEYGYNPNKKFIFIGTQVAEISINMSFDTILTEIAPLDALIQRGGRLHRTETHNNAKDCSCPQCKKLSDKHEYIFHVFDTGTYCYPYLTKKDVEEKNYKVNIINNTREVIINSPKFTFKNSIDMMNKVYDENSFSEDSNVIHEFKDKITEDLIFGKSSSFSEEDNGQLRIQTRDINAQNYTVLPQIICYDDYISTEDFLNTIHEKHNYDGEFTPKGISLINEYMITISSNSYNKIKSKTYEFDSYYFKTVDKNYNFKEGLIDTESSL
jgi:CRISPR-associated endonuclease/helicase Cas3